MNIVTITRVSETQFTWGAGKRVTPVTADTIHTIADKIGWDPLYTERYLSALNVDGVWMITLSDKEQQKANRVLTGRGDRRGARGF